MQKYLLLLRLDRSKLLETIGSLRNLPKNPSSGVDLNYTMNIFGTWHVAVWFSSDKSGEAIDFINRKISQIPGVVDAFPVAAFPHTGQREETSKGEESEDEQNEPIQKDEYSKDEESENEQNETSQKDEQLSLD